MAAETTATSVAAAGVASVRQVEGDLWDFFGKCWIVIPVNIGWRPKPEPDDPGAIVGPAPMGTGVAGQLAEKFPDAPYLWGHFCHANRALTPVLWTPRGWLYFPTKALDDQKPNMSWKAKANIVLIERSLQELASMRLPSKETLAGYAFGASFDTDEVAIPLIGCGSGKLREKQVLPLMEQYLKDDRFILVREPSKKDTELEHPF